MLGFSKDFVLFIVISILIGYATENWVNGAVFLGLYAIVKIIWKILT
jgi:hypothetical protein